VKTAISVPDETFARVDEAAARLGVSRSEFYARAAERWLVELRADLGLPRGSAPALRRPVLVVSDDRFNASTLRTVTVVVMTANRRLAAVPGNVAVPADVSGLAEDSVADITQVATVDRGTLEGDAVGELPTWLMAKVDDGMRLALGLT
jgi:mRNA interferase MazF